MKSLKIGNRIINENSKPYFIAEIGVNHEGSVSLAKKMIRQAKSAGMNAVKFQTYKAENLVIKKSPAYWDLKKESTRSQFELFKKFDKFKRENYLELYEYCKKIKIDFLSTPFDINSIIWLKKIMPAIKIASADINNYPLLKQIGLTKKKIFLSTGASDIGEIKYALKILNKFGVRNSNIVIMHCILNYPTKDIDANLKMIEIISKEFPNNIIGYSDHTLPSSDISPCSIAYLLGARVIEKHFTFNKNIKGNDHYHSMNKLDARKILNEIERIRLLLGNALIKNCIKSEKKSKKFARRSIVTKVDINKGDNFSSFNLITKRPGNGLSPIYWPKIIEKNQEIK